MLARKLYGHRQTESFCPRFLASKHPGPRFKAGLLEQGYIVADDGGAEASEEKSGDNQGAQKKRRLMIMIAAALLVLVGGGAAFFLMGSSKKSEDGEAKEATAKDHSPEEQDHGKAEGSPEAKEGKSEAKEGEGGHDKKKEKKKKEKKKKKEGEGEGEGHEKEGSEAEKKGGEKKGKKGEEDAQAKDDDDGPRVDFGLTYAMKPFHVNLGNPLENRYLRIEIALEYRNGEAQTKEIEARLPQLRDAVLSVASRKTREFLLGPDGKEQLRLEILNRINQYMDKKIEAVFITDILIE